MIFHSTSGGFRVRGQSFSLSPSAVAVGSSRVQIGDHGDAPIRRIDGFAYEAD